VTEYREPMTSTWPIRTLAATVALCAAGACTAGDDDAELAPRARIEVANLSAPGALQPSDGSAQDIMLSPGVWAVHGESAQLLEPGTTASAGIEALAEDGMTSVLLGELQSADDVDIMGSFAQVDGMTYEETPIGPGISASFEIDAAADRRVSMASMFIQSNDVLLATVPEGIALELAVGEMLDVTDSFALWDAGTEVNEEPGVGATQAPRQPAPQTGAAEGGDVARIDGTDAAGFAYPATDSFVRVTVVGLAAE
jgi:hypothetical protein